MSDPFSDYIVFPPQMSCTGTRSAYFSLLATKQIQNNQVRHNKPIYIFSHCKSSPQSSEKPLTFLCTTTTSSEATQPHAYQMSLYLTWKKKKGILELQRINLFSNILKPFSPPTPNTFTPLIHWFKIRMIPGKQKNLHALIAVKIYFNYVTTC